MEENKIVKPPRIAKNVLKPQKLAKTTRKEGYALTSAKKGMFVNQETGEIVEVVNFVSEGKDINFDRIFLGHLIEVVGGIGNAKIQFLLYLMSIKDSKNLIIKTQRAMLEETGLSSGTITTTLRALIDSDFIRMVQSGVYMINPDMIFKGSADRRMDILLTYKETAKKEEMQEEKISDDPSVFLQTPKSKKVTKKLK